MIRPVCKIDPDPDRDVELGYVHYHNERIKALTDPFEINDAILASRACLENARAHDAKLPASQRTMGDM